MNKTKNAKNEGNWTSKQEKPASNQAKDLGKEIADKGSKAAGAAYEKAKEKAPEA